jgi:predicted thioesterase
MLDLSNIRIGLMGTAGLTVAPEHTAPRVGSGRIAVLATPVMMNLIEAAALAAVEDLLLAVSNGAELCPLIGVQS